MLERLGRIAGNGVEAPRQLAGLRVVGGDVAADGVLRAAVADDHFALDDARRHRDRVRFCWEASFEFPTRVVRLPHPRPDSLPSKDKGITNTLP